MKLVEKQHFFFFIYDNRTICTFSIILDIMIIWTEYDFYGHDSVPLLNNFIILCYFLSIHISYRAWTFDSVDVPHPAATAIHYYTMDPYVNMVMAKSVWSCKRTKIQQKKKPKKSWKYEEKLDCWAFNV